jgi:hypothetical protein
LCWLGHYREGRRAKGGEKRGVEVKKGNEVNETEEGSRKRRIKGERDEGSM